MANPPKPGRLSAADKAQAKRQARILEEEKAARTARSAATLSAGAARDGAMPAPASEPDLADVIEAARAEAEELEAARQSELDRVARYEAEAAGEV